MTFYSAASLGAVLCIPHLVKGKAAGKLAVVKPMAPPPPPQSLSPFILMEEDMALWHHQMHQNRPQRRRQQDQGSTPEKVDGSQLCSIFEQCYTETNSQFDPSCNCNSYENYHEAVCYDGLERCIQNDDQSETCAVAYGGPHYTLFGGYKGSWTSYQFTNAALNGGTTIMSMWSSPGESSGDPCFLHVDGQACTQCFFSECDDGTLGFVADCSNKGYASDINSCRDKSSSGGSDRFRFFYERADFHLQCSEDKTEDASTQSSFDQLQGYPYARDSSEGWVSWTPEADDGSTLFFTDADGVATAKECAAKCLDVDAPSGAWNSEFGECFCYFVETGLCIEPCMQAEGVEFSTTPIEPLTYCEKSYCDEEKFYDPAFCDASFDKEACDEKIAELTNMALPTPTVNTPTTTASPDSNYDFSKYGYPYTQLASKGWVTFPPELEDGSTLELDGTSAGITNADECAARCQGEGAPSGAWNPKYGVCWCYFVETGLCIEPCIEEVGVEFSVSPISLLKPCEKSFCDRDWYYNEEYCDDTLSFDQAACDAKIAQLNADVPATDPEGILINQCSDTLALFGDSERAKAFIFAVSCSCEGDIKSAYTMECKATNYCFDWYSFGEACVDIVFTYDLEIDQTSGRLLNSGFVNRSACTTYLSGNGPGLGDSVQCKYSNPQCELVLRDEHFLYSRQALTICSSQNLCPGFFVELGYDNATAASFCPSTYLDETLCLKGADQICGIGAPGVVDADASSNAKMYGATADCSNVKPCATAKCREVELFDPESPKAIRSGPVYPQCFVGDDKPENIHAEEEVLDVYVQERYVKFTTGIPADSESSCGGICGSDPSSGCVPQGRTFYIEGHCYPIVNLGTSRAFGSKSYHIKDGSMICNHRYADQHCQVIFEEDEECMDIESAETCDEEGTIWKVVQAHCIESSSAVDEYVIPMVQTRVFASDEDCIASAAGDASVFVSQHSPNDPTLCQAGRHTQKDLSLPQLKGGVRTYCDTQTGEYHNEFYTNDNCTEQDVANMYMTKGTIGACTPPKYTEIFPDWLRYNVIGCKKDDPPQYHCKDFVTVGGLGIEFILDTATPSPTTSPTQPPTIKDVDGVTASPSKQPTAKGGGGGGGGGGGIPSEDSSAADMSVKGWILCLSCIFYVVVLW